MLIAAGTMLHGHAVAEPDGSSPDQALRTPPAEIIIRAHVDSEKVVVGDRFRFFVSVHGALSVEQRRVPSFANIPELELLDGPRLESQMLAQNGRRRLQTSDVYTLRALETGEAVIPPARIRLNGVWYETEPVRVEIVDVPALSEDGFEDALSATTGRSSIDRQLNGRLFALIEVPENVYRGQAVPVQIYVYRDPRIRPFQRWQLTQEPGGRDFVIPSAAGPRSAGQQQVRWEPTEVAGHQFERALVHTHYVVPTRSGSLRLEPPMLQVHLPTGDSRSRAPIDDFFTGRSSTVPAELPVRSRSIRVESPPTKPDEALVQFIGDATAAVQVDRTELPQRELLTLTVRVRGQGFFDLVSAPELPEIENLSLFDTRSRSQSTLSRGIMLSEREFQYLYQATQPGEAEIPEMVLAVFDPRTGEQKLQRTEPVQVRIEPAETGARVVGGAEGTATTPTRGDARQLGRDVAFIDTSPLTAGAMGRAAPPFYTQTWYWVLQLMVLAAALGYGTWAVWQRRGTAESEQARLRKARRVAEQVLTTAERGLNEAGREEYYASLKNGVASYTATLLSRSEKGLTEEEATEALGRLGYDEALRGRLQRVWRDCDAIRYSPAPDTPESRRKALEEARQLIQSFEERKSSA